MMKPVLLILLSLLFACSKSNVALQDKAPNIKTGERIDALHGTYLIDRATTEDELLKAIKTISDNYSSSFDWDKFYSDLKGTKLLKTAGQGTIKALLALNEKSCPRRNHTSFFNLVIDNNLGLDYLNYVFDHSDCGKDVPAILFGEYLKNVSEERLSETLDKLKSKTSSSSKLVALDVLWNKLKADQGTKFSPNIISRLINEDCRTSESSVAIFNFLNQNREALDMQTLFSKVDKACFETADSSAVLSFLKASDAQANISVLQYANSCEKCLNTVSSDDLLENTLKKMKPRNDELLKEVTSYFTKRCRPKALAEVMSVAAKNTETHALLNVGKCIPEFESQKLETLINDLLENFKESDSYAHKEVAQFLSSISKVISDKSWFLISKREDIVNSILASLVAEKEDVLYASLLDSLHEDVLKVTRPFVQSQFVKREGFAARMIQNYSFKEVYNLLNLVEVSSIADLSISDTVKLMSSLSVKEIERLSKKQSAPTEYVSLTKALEVLKVMDLIIEKALKDSKENNLVSFLVEKERGLLTFEEKFKDNSYYRSILEKDAQENLDATLLLVRTQNVKDRMDSVVIDFNRAKELQGISGYKNLLSSYIEMWIYSDVDSYEQARNNFCKNLKKDEFNPKRPGCYKSEQELILKNDPQWSLYSVVQTNGKNVQMEGSSFTAGIVDASNTSKASDYVANKPKAINNAMILPVVVQLTVPTIQNGPFNFEDENYRIWSGSNIFFRYYIVRRASTPSVKAPEGGKNGGNIVISKNLKSLPRLVSFGSAGQIPNEVTKGGMGISFNYPTQMFREYATQLPQEDKYDSSNEGHILAHDWTPSLTMNFFMALNSYIAGKAEIVAHIDTKDKYQEYCFYEAKITETVECEKYVQGVIKRSFSNLMKAQDDNNVSGFPFSSNNRVNLFQEHIEVEDAKDAKPEKNGPRGENGTITVFGKDLAKE